MLTKILVLVALAAIVVGAYASGIHDALQSPAMVREMLVGWGSWGYALYIASFVLLEPLGVPGVAFIIPASLVWSKPVAFVLSLVGGVGAGVVGFAFARFLARDWVEAHLPARFRRFDDQLETHGLKATIMVRLVFFMVPPSHWVLGLSKVRFGEFVVGTTIGLLPGVLVVTYLGGGFFAWLMQQPPWMWALAAAVALAALVVQRTRTA